ncbi:MAG: two-component system, OmpR family, sensor histidine kinase MprB [Solirubrobacteraceae bacterium]|nr:two-component system, OmpR family, sensor histidine kinase MprB [Solirubrobacteraceae bacterium]
MRPRLRLWGGLRGRLLLALVLTSVVTLGAAAAVVLSPLQQRLRDQSIESLRAAVLAARPRFENALARRGLDRQFALSSEAFELSDQTAGRVLATDLDLTPARGETPPGFLADSESGPPPPQAWLAALRTLRLKETVLNVRGDDVAIGVPLYHDGGVVGAVVARRRLTEVANAVQEVQRALLAAAAVGLLVAVALAVALASTLLRRLGRLRAAALRISAEGPTASMPSDSGHDEVGELARALGGMQEELRRQESARRAFVATASHELRTPQTMLQGTMELLEEDLQDGHVDLTDAQRQVATARRELLRLSTLAEELLDLSRLDAAVPMRSEAVELGELARAVAAEFELRAGEREIALELVPPTGACWGRGDPDAVARVVRILIDNALRYGGGESICVTAAEGGSAATVEVADRGPGVPAEERERIFERFYRGRGRGSEGGFGLGLAIGRELAERMAGTLSLTERPGGGTRFVLSLPRSPGAPSAGERPPDQAAAPAAG